jgi:methylated-DNA-protein-cysteine methyltransferase related protein
MTGPGLLRTLCVRQPGRVSREEEQRLKPRDERLERIWAAVAAIPRGRVASYGAIAARAGLPGRARMVGRALKLAPRALALPWHRVIGASGRIAFPPGSRAFREQTRRLKREGLAVCAGRVRLASARTREELDALLWGGPR